MPVEIVMPNLGFDSQESRLVEWLKQPGDKIRKGEPVAIVESDKAEVELESVAEGYLVEPLYQAGDMVPIGAVIAHISDSAEQPTASPPAAQPAAVEALPAEATSTEPAIASPLARRMAQEHGISLAQISGTGPGGRITRQDVEEYIGAGTSSNGGQTSVMALPKVRKAAREAGIDLAAVKPTGAGGVITMADLEAYQKPAAAAPVEAATPTPDVEGRRVVPMSRIREIIGKRMVAAKQDAPHFYVAGEFDIEAALARLDSVPGFSGRINDLIQYLTARTLLRVPELNATFEDGQLYHYDGVHLAVAIAMDDGLLTPVLHNADRYSLSGLAAESKALIQRARSNRLAANDLSGGTFTISNLGVIPQVDDFVAIINPPQVGILAVGTAKARPVVIDGGLHIRHTFRATLSGDHRVVDGMHLGRFMAAFQEELDYFSAGKGAV